MHTNATLRKMLDTIGCRAPIRFSRFPRGSEGLCIPFLGIYVNPKYRALPDPYLRAVVYHEAGHWRDPLHWLSLLAVPGLLAALYALVRTENVLWLDVIYLIMAAGYFVRRLKERRADAFARWHMPDYDRYDPTAKPR